MRIEESIWVKQTIHRIVKQGDLCINLGSSDEGFYKYRQPHIYTNIVGHIRDTLQAELLNCDAKIAPGVDIAGDFTEPELLDHLFERQPTILLVNNLFEHMKPDVLSNFVSYLDKSANIGTKILITVPHSYPIHFDPIDTYFRPSPKDLAAMFPAWRVLKSDIIESDSFSEEFGRMSIGQKLYLLARLALPFIKPKGWISRVHRFLWWKRPYEVSGILIEKI